MKHGNRLKDMAGQRFGLLTVLEYAYTKHDRAYWQVKCDCGETKAVAGSELRRRTTKSCGCNRGKEIIGLPQNVKRDRTYHIWHGMKSRCFNPINPRYSSYGGRGITICKRWLEYANFLLIWVKRRSIKALIVLRMTVTTDLIIADGQPLSNNKTICAPISISNIKASPKH